MARIQRPTTLGAVLLGVLLGVAFLTWVGPGEIGRVRRSAPVPAVEIDVRPERAPDPPADAVPSAPLGSAASNKAAAGRLLVDVVDEDGRSVPDAWVIPLDCPGFIGVDAGEYAVQLGPCALAARRLDGVLIARSAPAMVVVRDEEPAQLTLYLPTRRVGGVGIRFQPESHGMRVVEVVPGTPADEAGVEPGDLILAVGDAPVAGMDSDQFVATMTGDEGTDVEFTVRAGEPRDAAADTGVVEHIVRVTRAYLEG